MLKFFLLSWAQKFIIQESKFCRIDQVFCSSFYHESKSENLFLTKYYPKCPKISKERKKVQVARSLCPKTTNYPTSPIPEKKTHSNHICRLFSSLHCRYKHIPNIHTHDWDGIFIDNTFYKGILLLPITVPNHGYRYLQSKRLTIWYLLMEFWGRYPHNHQDIHASNMTWPSL